MKEVMINEADFTEEDFEEILKKLNRKKRDKYKFILQTPVFYWMLEFPHCHLTFFYVGNGVQYLGGRYQCLSAELGVMWSLTPKSGGTLFGAKGHMILDPPF